MVTNALRRAHDAYIVGEKHILCKILKFLILY